MAKAIVLCYRDVETGTSANEMILRAEVRYHGVDVPGGVLNSLGANDNGVPITVNITAMTQYPNNVEDALIADAVRLGLPTLLRTDCLFPSYTRGA